MTRILAFVWALAALVIAYLAFKIAIGPKADASGWWLALGFCAAACLAAWQAWKEWGSPGTSRPKPSAPQSRSPEPASPAGLAPGAWRGARVPLEAQIEALKNAGLEMEPDRTIRELLESWPRDEYENDPYNLILFMYGSEVEAEPWGRKFCRRGWNFDMECLSEAGDYARAFQEIAGITGQPDLVKDLSDTFDIDADTCTITFSINGQRTEIEARIDNDWADPRAVAEFVLCLEAAIRDGRRFWAADNGQSSILFFLTDTEAAKINALRPEILVRYVNA